LERTFLSLAGDFDSRPEKEDTISYVYEEEGKERRRSHLTVVTEIGEKRGGDTILTRERQDSLPEKKKVRVAFIVLILRKKKKKKRKVQA